MKTALLLAACCCLLPNAQAQEKKADVLRAQTLFRAKCAACHSVACNRHGPRLEGLMGRTAGSVADYPHYTAELKASGIVWTDKTLDDYIADPGKLVPGTSMTAAGRVPSAGERRDIVAHLRRQDRSIDLCL